MRNTLRALGILLLAGFLAMAGFLAQRLTVSLPKMDGEIAVHGPSAAIEVASDRLGIPVIQAVGRTDAFFALGYLHARDRLFQMDLMRRKTAGRLAELFGEKALALDQRQRSYEFAHYAAELYRALPPAQRRVHEAYAAGVNEFLASAAGLPFEFLMLDYRPEAWRPEDSLLIALGMFQILTGHEQDERMLTVMNQCLPREVVEFLTPDVDPYTTTLVGGDESRRPARPIPIQAIAGLLGESQVPTRTASVDPDAVIAGSNQWVVGGAKTRDGRAIVANDMHLDLAVPNIWYRAELRYEKAALAGVSLPGVPLLVAGSNGRIAWGFTNVDADVMDLVQIERNPVNPSEYRTPAGWQALESHTETIHVKGRAPVRWPVARTVWGPLSPEPLLGEPVAVRWTALVPGGLNLGLVEMDRAGTLEEASAVMNRAGSPPQNVVLADEHGRIAWTYMGVFPNRLGFDGATSQSWADGRIGWRGFIAPESLPRLIDPPEGFIATANNRTLGKEYPHVIGHNFSHSYRAYRISERLRAMDRITERDLLDLQLDTVSEFYDFYRRLVLELTGRTDEPLLADARQSVAAWDGRMDAGSRGIPLLVAYRQRLAKRVFAPMLARCTQMEPNFSYAWRELDTPLTALLSQRIPETLPERDFADWDAFLRTVLSETVRDLKAQHAVARVDELTWGRVNRVRVRHPFGKSAPFLSPLIDMPDFASPGCSGYCVRVVSAAKGASERMVVSPAHHGEGILHMPGGQSGHPLSSHYRDQQAAWAEGGMLGFSAGTPEHRLRLVPSDTP